MATRNDSWRGGGSGRGAYTLTANSATQTPLTLVLAAGSTANGLRINDSAGNALFTLDASGNLTIAGTANVTVNEVVTGNIELTGNLVVNGNSTLGNAATDQLNVYANSIFRYNATVWNDLAVNNDVYVSHSLNFEDVASTPNSSGNHGKLYTQITSGLIELYYLDSAGATVQVTSNGSLNGGEVFFADDTYVRMGNTAASPDVRLGWNTAQTVDGLYLGLSDGQNTFIIAENGDRAYDFAHGAQTNPTVYLQSAAQSATEFSAWNAGKISFGLGIATVATDYVVGRNADGTNLLQFNVPTGASFEFSVNDVAQMTMSATAVNFQDNSLTTTGGGSLTGTWTDLGIVTTVDINGGTVDGTIIGGAVAAAGTFTAIVGTSLDLNGALDLDVAALGATITNTADTASSQIVIFEGDRATVADGDEAYLTFRLSDSAGNQDEGARITWKATTVASGATQDTDLVFSALVNNVLTTMLTLDGSANEIVPAVAINSAAAITGTAITATSFVIGANTLTTSEWAFLDGQDQSVFTTSNPTFGNLTITSFAANWTNAGRTVADLGIVTTVDINGGTLDGVTIGGAAAAAGTFTALTATSLDLNGALDLDVAALGATITNTADAASSQIAIFEGDRATIADGDEGYLTFRLSDSAGNQDEQARITWKATTVLSGATQDGDLIFSALVNNVLTEAMRIDGSAGGVVLINGTAAYGRFGQTLEANTSADYGGIAIHTWSTTAANGPILDIGRSKSATIGTHTVVVSGDGVGFINFHASDGDQFIDAANITCYVDGTPGNNDMPGRLGFGTTADGAQLITQRMVILSSGIVSIGGTTNTAYGRLGQLFEVNGPTDNYGGVALNNWQADSSGPLLDFNKSRSGVIGTQTVVAQNDLLGGMVFRGSDGVQFRDAASIAAYVDGAITGGGAADMPGRIVFNTTPDGSVTLLQRMTILNSGVVTIGGTTNTAYGRNGELLEVNTSANNGGTALNTWAASTAGGLLDFNKSRSATIGTHTVVQNADSLGEIDFRGSDGVSFRTGAYIGAEVDGAVSGAGAADMPTRLIFGTAADGTATVTQRMTILNSGVVTIGGTTNTAYGRLGELFEINTSANFGGQTINTWSGTQGEAGIIDFNRSKSATIGTHTTVANGDALGFIVFRGSDGVEFLNAASIIARVDGVVTGGGTNDMPGRLEFNTTPDGTADAIERMRISSDGTVDMADRFIMNGTAKTLTDAATSLFDITLTAGAMSGGAVMWTIEASDGTDHQSLSGITTWAAVNKAGAYTTTVNNDTANDSKAVSAGTLTASWDLLSGVNKVTLRVTPTGSLTETTYRITYQIINNTASAITIL